MTSEVKPVAAGFVSFAAWIAGWRTPPNCSTGSTELSCKLASFLPVLYVIATVLAIALLAVVAIAVHAWRKTRETDLLKRQ